MKRIGWLVLLISLGLNLGLGYRLLKQPSSSGDLAREEQESGSRHWRRQRPPEGQEGVPAEEMRSTRRDSSDWHRIMSGRLKRIADRLELTPDQLAVFKAGHEQNAPLILGQRRLVDQARDRLKTVIAEGEVAPDSVRLAIQSVGREQARLDSLVTESMLREMEVLNPEQRAQYLRILPVFKDWQAGRGEGRGGRFRDH